MILKIENLVKTYKPFFLSKKAPMQAVKNVSFGIGEGEIYALLGPNGAGKSTIIKMIAGLVKPTSGKITFKGQEISKNTAYKNLSAVLEGTRNVYWRLNPLENLNYFANLRGVSSTEISTKTESLLKDLEIDAKKKNQSQHLSRGMLQKLALAVSLITDPDILLLDEPTLGLDVASSRKIKDIIFHLAKKEGKSILLTTHQMDLVEELADRVGIIRNGELVKEGSIPNLKSIFKSNIYTLKLKGKMIIPEIWKKNYKAILKTEAKEFTEIELDLKNREGFFKFLNEINKLKKEILSISRLGENLEEVFLRVLKAND
jgi:ABC-2 type transport system ATP-binding protein